MTNPMQPLHFQALFKLLPIGGILLFFGCSTIHNRHHQVTDADLYLNTPPLQKLQVPDSIQLPAEDPTYQIPVPPCKGSVGRALNIAPPPQLIARPQGSEAYFQGRSAVLLFNRYCKQEKLWKKLQEQLAAERIAISKVDKQCWQLTTEWMTWPPYQKTHTYAIRYQLHLKIDNKRPALVIQLLGAQQQGKELKTPLPCEYYTAWLLNRLSFLLEKL